MRRRLLELRKPRRVRLCAGRKHPLDVPWHSTARRIQSDTARRAEPRWPRRSGHALAALIRTAHPEATVLQVRQMLARTRTSSAPGPYGDRPRRRPVPAAPGSSTTATDASTSSARSPRRAGAPSSASARPPPPPPPPPPPRSAIDADAPTVHVYAARAHPGALVRLRYRVHDNKGETTEKISVYRRTRALRQLTRSLRPTENAVVYWIKLACPARARLVPLLRPRHRRRGKPQPARLRLSQRSLSSRLRYARQRLRPRARRPRSASCRRGRLAPRALPSWPAPCPTSRR